MSATPVTNTRPLGNRVPSPSPASKKKNIYGPRSMYKNELTLDRLKTLLQTYINKNDNKQVREKNEEIRKWKEKKAAFDKIRNRTNMTNEQKFNEIKAKNKEINNKHESWGEAIEYRTKPKVGLTRTYEQIKKLTTTIKELKAAKPVNQEALIKKEQERRNKVTYIKQYKIYHNTLNELARAPANNTKELQKARKTQVKDKYEALQQNFKPLTTREQFGRYTGLGKGFAQKNSETVSNKILAYAGLSKEQGERTILHTELVNVIKSLFNSSKSTENNQVQVGKDVIEKIFTLIVKVYGYVKQMPYAKSSPFVQGIKNGWETYNAQKIRRPTSNLIARKIQVNPETVDKLLKNLYKSVNNRTEAHGTEIGKNIGQLFFNLQNKNYQTQKKYYSKKEISTKYAKHLRQKIEQKKFIKSIIYGTGLLKKLGNENSNLGLKNLILNKLGNSKLRKVVNVTLTNEKLKQLQTLLYIISIHKKKTYTNSKEAEMNGTILGKQMATLLNNYGNILRAKSGTTNVPLSNNKQKIIRNYKIGVLHGFKPLILKQMDKSTLKNLIRYVTYKPHVNTVRSMYNNPSKLISSVAKLLATGVVAAVCHNFTDLHGKYFYGVLIAQAAQVAKEGAQWKWKTLSPEIKCLINQLLSEFSSEIAPRIHDNSFLDRPLLLIIALLNAYKRHHPDKNHVYLNKGIEALKNVDKFTTKGGRTAGVFMKAVNIVTKEPIKAMRRVVIPDAIKTKNNIRQKFFNNSGLIKYKKYFNAVSGLSTNGNKINLQVAVNAIVRPNKNLLKQEIFNPRRLNNTANNRKLTANNRKLLLLLQKKANQNRSTLFQAVAPTRLQKLFGYEPNNKSTWRNRLGRVLPKKENFKFKTNVVKPIVAVLNTHKVIPKTFGAGGKIIGEAAMAVPSMKVRSRGKKRRAGGR